MKRNRFITTLLAAAFALLAVVAVPALAHRGEGPESNLLDEDLSLAGDLPITAAGTTKTRTFEDDEGVSHTVVVRRGLKAAGAVTSDVKTAAGADPGELQGALKLKTKTRDNTRGKVEGTLTVTSADGKFRLKLHGRRFDDGNFEAHVRGARGSGAFAGLKVHGDADVTIDDDSVALEIDGEYGYRAADEGGGERHRGDEGRRGPGGGER
jgi:hypothetical protein